MDEGGGDECVLSTAALHGESEAISVCVCVCVRACVVCDVSGTIYVVSMYFKTA